MKKVFYITDKTRFVYSVTTTKKVAKAKIKMMVLEYNEYAKLMNVEEVTEDNYLIEEVNLWSSSDLHWIQNKIKIIKEAE